MKREEVLPKELASSTFALLQKNKIIEDHKHHHRIRSMKNCSDGYQLHQCSHLMIDFSDDHYPYHRSRFMMYFSDDHQHPHCSHFMVNFSNNHQLHHRYMLYFVTDFWTVLQSIIWSEPNYICRWVQYFKLTSS